MFVATDFASCTIYCKPHLCVVMLVSEHWTNLGKLKSAGKKLRKFMNKCHSKGQAHKTVGSV